MSKVNIALGANIGEPAVSMRQAAERLGELGEVLKRSGIYRTKPWGLTEQPDFLNAVVQIETNLAPGPLLKELKAIEQQLGRTKTVRWGPRLIDLDILTYDSMVHSEPGLDIPHPRMLERSFVLVPLCEIDQSELYANALQALTGGDTSEVWLSEFGWAD
jgi:2-amino-4-hydroxy-6-hydroxymethyldihydropteridine diphosphokinase